MLKWWVVMLAIPDRSIMGVPHLVKDLPLGAYRCIHLPLGPHPLALTITSCMAQAPGTLPSEPSISEAGRSRLLTLAMNTMRSGRGSASPSHCTRFIFPVTPKSF